MFDLNFPAHWKISKMKRICKLIHGQKLSNKTFPYLEVKVLRGSKEKIFLDSGEFVPEGKKIILVDGENSGEVFTTPEDGYLGSTFRILEISDRVAEKFLEYFIFFQKDFYRDMKIGSAIPHLD